ncbi:YybH family protein [Labrys okinawensis]|uniref:YybH family protein n=1 Tax=Labrys okinawensis TaxID=346911 RepID=UPI0039BC4CCD
MLRPLLGVILAAAAAMAQTSAFADPAADKAAIVERFQRWAAAFNAKDPKAACDLFAPDLLYSVPELIQGTHETMCANLTKVFARPDITLRYENPDIHEIIVAGDVAVVRLTWTLVVAAKGTTETTSEEGMDIFRRQPDGRWSIARFIAFTTKPNELLK